MNPKPSSPEVVSSTISSKAACFIIHIFFSREYISHLYCSTLSFIGHNFQKEAKPCLAAAEKQE